MIRNRRKRKGETMSGTTQENITMTAEAREMKAAYYRKWRKDNADRVKIADIKYWNRKAEEQKHQEA